MRSCSISLPAKDNEVQIARRRKVSPQCRIPDRNTNMLTRCFNIISFLARSMRKLSERVSGCRPMIRLTENAVAAFKTALSLGAKPGEGRRIMVEAGGCAGLGYGIHWKASR